MKSETKKGGEEKKDTDGKGDGEWYRDMKKDRKEGRKGDSKIENNSIVQYYTYKTKIY